MIYVKYKNTIKAVCLWRFLFAALNMNTTALGKQILFILSTKLKMTDSRPVQYCSYCMSGLQCECESSSLTSSSSCSASFFSSSFSSFPSWFLHPLTQKPLPLILSSIVVYAREQTWLLIIKLWFLCDLICSMCLLHVHFEFRCRGCVRVRQLTHTGFQF